MSPPGPTDPTSSLYIGLDLGTSGCRAVAVDAAGGVVAEFRAALPEPVGRDGGREQDPGLWWDAVDQVLRGLGGQITGQAVRALAVDGTSGTVLLTDASGEPLGPALMYNDNRAVAEADHIARIAPPASAAHGTGSGLAKLLWLLARHAGDADGVATQADWIAGRLCGRPGISDANNVLKLGWDPLAKAWPAWLGELGVPRTLLPQVLPPGTPLRPLIPALAGRWGLSPDTVVVSGTTDSTAAILATGAGSPGDGITSLGSTLVTKVIAAEPLFAPEYGVYSQPLGEHWLVGGGSNSGGAVLKHFFTPAQMRELSAHIDPDRPTVLDYYPLLTPGERFPYNDPARPPRLSPRPQDDVRFFQGLLEGIAAIEAGAYRRLAQLGAPYPGRVFSVGGGAANAAWTRIRAKQLGVPLVQARHAEAAYGTALLARRGVAQPH
jgi:sugar (pentulose or hexulose) kinase